MPTGTYNYGRHGSRATVYRWPVDIDGATRYARLSRLTAVEPFLTLPFTDPDVKRGGIWRYGNGGWHHAGDYSQGDATFEVLAVRRRARSSTSDGTRGRATRSSSATT